MDNEKLKQELKSLKNQVKNKNEKLKLEKEIRDLKNKNRDKSKLEKFGNKILKGCISIGNMIEKKFNDIDKK